MYPQSVRELVTECPALFGVCTEPGVARPGAGKRPNLPPPPAPPGDKSPRATEDSLGDASAKKTSAQSKPQSKGGSKKKDSLKGALARSESDTSQSKRPGSGSSTASSKSHFYDNSEEETGP